MLEKSRILYIKWGTRSTSVGVNQIRTIDNIPLI